MGGALPQILFQSPIFRVVLGLGEPVGSDPFLTERKRRFSGGVRVCLYVSKRVFCVTRIEMEVLFLHRTGTICDV